MKDVELSTIVELAKLKNDKPEEYAKVRSSIKEVLIDMERLAVEIVEEIDAENDRKKKKAREELDLRIAEKMQRDKPSK
jgi:hypothetical protein